MLAAMAMPGAAAAEVYKGWGRHEWVLGGSRVGSWVRHGRVVGASWSGHRRPMGGSWAGHRRAMGASWASHGSFMGGP